MVDQLENKDLPSPRSQPLASNEEEYEERHVHQVYEQIASHFSATRYKPWPVVENFLSTLPKGSVGIDAGCGNGKYLQVNPSVFIIASDRSQALTRIASKHQPHSSIVADSIELPHPVGIFDFAISIAVIHHFSTPERRVSAVRALLDIVRPQAETSPLSPLPRSVYQDTKGGRVLIFVWALEQRHSRRGWDTGDDQDVLVPWVSETVSPRKLRQTPTSSSPSNHQDFTSSQSSKCDIDPGQTPDSPAVARLDEDKVRTKTIYQRFYHLFRRGELEACILEAGGIVLDSGYEKDNWWAIATRKPLANPTG